MTNQNNDSFKKETLNEQPSYMNPPNQQPSVVFIQPQSAISLGNKPQAAKW
jgi:hypothetical protein